MGSVLREELLTASETADPRVLDLVHLRRYTMDNAALERELLSLFIGQLPTILDQISQANNAEDWRFALHTLKGSARAIGANAIAEIAELLEMLGHADEVAALIGKLAGEARRFEDAASKLLN